MRAVGIIYGPARVGKPRAGGIRTGHAPNSSRVPRTAWCGNNLGHAVVSAEWNQKPDMPDGVAESGFKKQLPQEEMEESDD